MINIHAIDLSKESHVEEDRLLAKFYETFLSDKRNQIPNFDSIFHPGNGAYPTVKSTTESGKLLWFITLNDVIGFVTFSGSLPPYRKCVGIYDFFIDAPYRNSGIGSQAFDIIVARLFMSYPSARRIGLSVFSNNHHAKHIYEKKGFRNNLEVMLLDRN